MKINYKNQVMKITFIYLAIFIPLILFRFPDIRNEIKYLAITKESLNNNLFILKYLDNLYPDKPPFYFWILKLIHTYFPKYFFQLGILIGSVIPSYIIAILSYKFLLNFKNSYKYIEKLSFTIVLGLIASPLFIGGTSVLRMDILMYLFIFSSIYLFFNMYYNFKKINFKNLFSMYLFIFLGLFTKGIVGIVAPLSTMIIFLLFNRDLKFLKKIHFMKGIIFILSCVSLWFLNIYFCEDGLQYIKLLVGQETLGRITKSKAHIRPVYYYLKTLPVISLPYGLGVFFSLFYYLKNIKSFIKWNELEKIFFCLSVPLFILLSFASGKLVIYLLPTLYGFIGLTVMYFFRFKPISSNRTLNNFSYGLLLVIFIISINGNYYSRNYTLKPLLTKIENIENENIYTYRFEDFQNTKFIIKKNIIPITNGTSIKIPKENYIITKANKKKEISKDFKNLKLISKNKNYYLYKI
ncbi:ArnT family glycosyltransferase [Fusobacterium sp. MFO224]|uniref:ArnT family glycosyltransferase n=1 Tax=Fusobacterium sp. MFO224 TaxID=3378070 RepID=UPI0038552927